MCVCKKRWEFFEDKIYLQKNETSGEKIKKKLNDKIKRQKELFQIQSIPELIMSSNKFLTNEKSFENHSCNEKNY